MSTSTQSTLSLPDLPGIEPGWELLNLREPAQRGKFTAEQLARNEAKLNAVIAALGERLGIRQIARAFAISTNTVLQVSRIYGPEIDTQKESLGRDFLDVARLAVERMRDEIDLMPRASLPIIAGVSSDKGQLLTGSPTARVAHEHTHTIADVADFIDSLPSVTPVAAEKANDQKALTAPGDLTAIEVVDSQADDADRDSQSLASAQVSEETPGNRADDGQNLDKKEPKP